MLAEEGRPPESVFDFVQGTTAVARSKPLQDARLVMEGKAKVLLEKVAWQAAEIVPDPERCPCITAASRERAASWRVRCMRRGR